MTETGFTSPQIVESEAAGAAAQAALQQLRDAPDELIGLGGITDEELVAYVGDPGECHPFGEWYPTLSPEEKQLAQMAALRTLTTREQFVLAGDTTDATFVMPDQTLALLALRRAQPTLTAQRQTSDGVSWYLLRKVGDDAYLRELTTPQGYRSYALSTACKGLRDELLRWMYLPEGATAADVDTTVSTSELAGGSDVSFLEGCDSVTTLVRVGEGFEDGGDVRLIHVRSGQGFVGRPLSQDSMTYAGADEDAVAALWDEWQAMA